MYYLSTRVLERQLQIVKTINKNCIERVCKNWLKKREMYNNELVRTRNNASNGTVKTGTRN